jgi:hypothetical protein
MNTVETISILNKTYKVKDLNLIASTQYQRALLAEYRKDANCSPFDWINGEKIHDLQKAAFIYSSLKTN